MEAPSSASIIKGRGGAKEVGTDLHMRGDLIPDAWMDGFS